MFPNRREERLLWIRREERGPSRRSANATGDMKLSTYVVGLRCVYVDLSKPLSRPPSRLLGLVRCQQLVVAPACRASETACIVSFRLFSNREKIREDKGAGLGYGPTCSSKNLRPPPRACDSFFSLSLSPRPPPFRLPHLQPYVPSSIKGRQLGNVDFKVLRIGTEIFHLGMDFGVDLRGYTSIELSSRFIFRMTRIGRVTTR